MKRIYAFTLGMIFLTGVAVAANSNSPMRAGSAPAYFARESKGEKLVQKAVAFYKEKGLDATVAAVNETKGQFTDGKSYIFIDTFEGINIARADGDTKSLGSNVLNDKDLDGKFYVQEMIKKAQKDGSGRETYRLNNPVTGKPQFMRSYFEKIDGAIIGSGFLQES